MFLVGPRAMPGIIDALHLGHTHRPTHVSGREKATMCRLDLYRFVLSYRKIHLLTVGLLHGSSRMMERIRQSLSLVKHSQASHGLTKAVNQFKLFMEVTKGVICFVFPRKCSEWWYLNYVANIA